MCIVYVSSANMQKKVCSHHTLNTQGYKGNNNVLCGFGIEKERFAEREKKKLLPAIQWSAPIIANFLTYRRLAPLLPSRRKLASLPDYVYNKMAAQKSLPYGRPSSHPFPGMSSMCMCLATYPNPAIPVHCDLLYTPLTNGFLCVVTQQSASVLSLV